jgi:hypothetical protein
MSINNFDYTVIWRLDAVEILKGEHIPDDKTDILELRAFNKDKEYRWNPYGERTASDENAKYIDELHKLWGTPSKDANGNAIPYKFDGSMTTLTEDRGTVVKVPFEVPTGHCVFIKVRNYLSAEDKPFEFIDWRFVEFLTKEAKEEYVER